MFWLAYITITLCLLYVIYKIEKNYYWCKHNFKVIKNIFEKQFEINKYKTELIRALDYKIDLIANKKGGKNVKKK